MNDQTSKEKFYVRMQPYLDRIEPFEDFSEYQIYKFFRAMEGIKSRTKEECKAKLIRNHHMRCALVLEAIEQSWAQYETFKSLEEVLDFTFKDSTRAQECCTYLAHLKLIERKGERVRRLTR